MEQFMDENFLLKTETARKLYHEHAEKMPIYDYHCHLPVKEIYENRHFENITKLWLVEDHFGDHYKWRAMRNNGVEEKYITGNASDKEKFMKWAETVPYTVGNPLYHWTHLELKRFFGINTIFSPKTAEKDWEIMNKYLAENGTRDIIASANVETLCTTDDPVDDLHYHKAMYQDKTMKFHVYPAFRPDKVINVDWDSYVPYIKQLSGVVGYEINDLYTLEKALKERIEYFHEAGCRISDHALDVVMYESASEEEVNAIAVKAIKGEKLTASEIAKYRGFIIIFLGREYHAHKWVQQYHIKALRNNNGRMMRSVGADTGFDSINDGQIAAPLSKILNTLDSTDELPKTIVYSLNPSDNEVLATLAFCFAEPGVPGKMQLGSGWWFLDQKDGMEKQLTALSNLGLLSRFIGMLTDSRSFISYTRHEYFRRVLCNFLGDLVENGEYPNDMEFLGKVVEDICYNNAKRYFDESR